MRAFLVATIPLVALFITPRARADDAHLVRINFAASDRDAQLVGTRFISINQYWTSGPVVGGFTRSEILCTGTCTREIDPDLALHVGGAGITSSKQFLLPANVAAIDVRASTGSSTPRALGAFFTFTGASLVGLGAGFIGVHLLGRPIDADSTLRTTGFALAGSGVLFLAIGLPLYLANGTSVATAGSTRVAFTPRGIVF